MSQVTEILTTVAPIIEAAAVPGTPASLLVSLGVEGLLAFAKQQGLADSEVNAAFADAFNRFLALGDATVLPEPEE